MAVDTYGSNDGSLAGMDPTTSLAQKRTLLAPDGTSSTQPISPESSLTPRPANDAGTGSTLPKIAALPPLPPPPPDPNAPYTAPTGQTFVGGTQTTDPKTGNVTQNGALGYGYVPGSGNGLIDLGGGNVAPAVSGQSTMTILPPTLPPDYAPMGMKIGDVTAAGKITGWNELGGPIYDKSSTNAAVPDPFAHTWDGLQAGDLAAQGFSSDPFNTPGHTIAGSTPTAQEMIDLFKSRLTSAPSAANGTPAKSPFAAPTGPASGVGTPSSGVGSSLPGSSQAGAGGLPSFGPGNDLRASLIGPNASGRLTDLQSLVDQANKGVSGIDRVKNAQDMFNTFASSTTPAYEAALRSATQRGAASGTLGSGMLNTSYGDLAHNRALELDNQKNALIQDALSQSVNDALNKQRALAGMEGQIYGQEAGNRGELRTERGYQTSQEQDAFNRALEQFLVQQQAQNQAFNQGLSLLGGASAGNPGSTIGNIANGMQGLDPQTIAYLSQILGKNSVQPTAG